MKKRKFFIFLTEIINIFFAVSMLYIDKTTSIDAFFSYCFAGIIVYNSMYEIIKLYTSKKYFLICFNKFLESNNILVFLFFSVIGSGPSIIQKIYVGFTYNFPHIINNCITIPLIICSYKIHFQKLENKHKIFTKYLNKNNNYEQLIMFIKLFINISIYYVLYFTLSNWNIELINSVSKIWNCIFLIIVLFLYLLFLLFTFIAINTFDKNIDGSELFPAKAQNLMDCFFVIWLMLVFIGGRVEMYYSFCVLGNIALRWIQFIMCKKKFLFADKKLKKLSILNIGVTVFMLVYLVIVNYVNSQIHWKQETYSIILAFFYFLVALFIFINIIWNKGED